MIYLEHVEGLELNGAALVSQESHHQLEVVGRANVPTRERDRSERGGKRERETETESRGRSRE